MRLPSWITFTGLDERTDLDRVLNISERYPVEWGVLFSPKRQGVQPRYPRMSVVENIFRCCPDIKISAHVCGGYSRQLISGTDIPVPLGSFDRFQVNYVPNPLHHPEAAADTGEQLGVAEIREYPWRGAAQPIVQWRTLTMPVSGTIHYLFDKSGGNGKAPANWPKHPGGNQMIGYAGGLGPDTVREQLLRMNPAGPFYIDMEGNVRTEDWLDLDKVERVCQQVYETGLENA